MLRTRAGKTMTRRAIATSQPFSEALRNETITEKFSIIMPIFIRAQIF